MILATEEDEEDEDGLGWYLCSDRFSTKQMQYLQESLPVVQSHDERGVEPGRRAGDLYSEYV